jgi:hypothetical protein
VNLVALPGRVLRLRARDWGVLAEGLATAVAVEAGLWAWPLARLVRWAESRPGRRPPSESGDMARVASLATWPQRIPGWPSSCLRRSLVVTAVLRRRRLPAKVCVGVRKDDGRLHAHAWVECGDTVLGSASERFEPLLPSASRSVQWSP